jgi:hypothetical protein
MAIAITDTHTFMHLCIFNDDVSNTDKARTHNFSFGAADP